MNEFILGQIIIVDEPLIPTIHSREAIILSPFDGIFYFVSCYGSQYYLKPHQIRVKEKPVLKVSANPPDLGIDIYE